MLTVGKFTRLFVEGNLIIVRWSASLLQLSEWLHRVDCKLCFSQVTLRGPLNLQVGLVAGHLPCASASWGYSETPILSLVIC